MSGNGAFWAIMRRPWLWGEAVRTVAAMSPREWWKTRPFIPQPDPTYMAWRRATAYGSEAAPVSSKDLVDYLEWRRRFRAATGNGVIHG
ncbi:MAG: hypothetical protein HKN91_16305 [Acidimicrobiia bacterium]|nr:hypothetical protein [Acidimicrobiia bacterium]